MKCCLYRFLDADLRIIYIGKTTDTVWRRLHGHKHLPNDCYEQVWYIEVAEVQSGSDLNVYELYYINKYKPDYNTASKSQDVLSVQLPPLTWKLCSFEKMFKLKWYANRANLERQYQMRDYFALLDVVYKQVLPNVTEPQIEYELDTVDEYEDFRRLLYSDSESVSFNITFPKVTKLMEFLDLFCIEYDHRNGSGRYWVPVNIEWVTDLDAIFYVGVQFLKYMQYHMDKLYLACYAED